MTDVEKSAQPLRFEREPCGRCGGSGRYSYNQIDGDRCFGCAGKGVVLTKRAKIAAARLTASRQVRADAIKVGDVVRLPGGRVRKITAVGPSSSRYQKKDGSWVAFYQLTAGSYGLCTTENETVEIVPDGATARQQLEDAIAYQNSLTKAGKPRR